MKTILKLMSLAALTLSATALLAACGGSSGDSDIEEHVDEDISSAADPTEVDVTLTDFAIDSSLTAFEAGVPYHFVITNDGVAEHELMIMPVVEGGSMDMEAMDEMAVAMVEEDDLPAGATVTLDITFDEADIGNGLELACHMPAHYEHGMHLPITVS